MWCRVKSITQYKTKSCSPKWSTCFWIKNSACAKEMKNIRYEENLIWRFVCNPIEGKLSTKCVIVILCIKVIIGDDAGD